MTNIYALIDPITSECRYVGKANCVATRLRTHLYNCEHSPHKVAWIRKLKKIGNRPILIVLERVPMETWPEAEIFWVEYMRWIGADLTNACAGGLGGNGFKPTAERRKQMSEMMSTPERKNISRQALAITRCRPDVIEKLRQYRNLPYTESRKAKLAEAARIRVWSDESRQKLATSATGRKHTDETKKKVSDAGRGRFVSEETLLKRSAALKGHAVSAETRAKIGAKAKGRPISEEAKKKMSVAATGRVVSDETRAKRSAALKGRIISEAHRAKLSIALTGRVKSTETLAKARASQIARWDKYYAETGKQPCKSSVARRLRKDENKK